MRNYSIFFNFLQNDCEKRLRICASDLHLADVDFDLGGWPKVFVKVESVCSESVFYSMRNRTSKTF